MKKIIFILIAITSLLLAGGIYLINAITANAVRFDETIMFHQVEILREHLALNIYRVEADLYSQNALLPESRAALDNHLFKMNEAIEECFECHHEPAVDERLTDLYKQVKQFQKATNDALALLPSDRRHRQMAETAHLIGDSLISKINTMIAITGTKLNAKTEETISDVHRTRNLLIALVAFGPALSIILALVVIRGVSGPIRTLLSATRSLKAGNLDYRITGLHDEFAELALGFNAMADSLQSQMKMVEASEKKYRVLFESAADSIFILDPDGDRAGQIIAANQAAAVMHGYTIDELQSMNIRQLDAPDAAALFADRLKFVSQGNWIKTEINHVKKDGTVFPVEISAGMIDLGDRRYILAIDRDITERKHMAYQLMRSEQIKYSGELATGLAHEIKNPLAGIKASMEVLSHEDYLTPEDKEVLRLVIGEIMRIEMLIKGLLSFARPPLPHFSQVDVNALMNSVISMVQVNAGPQDPSGRITILRDLDQQAPMITADPMQLRQVFLNVLINAAEALQGKGVIFVKTRFDPSVQTVTVEIADTGKDVDPSILDRIFQPFFTTKPKGTGLGLAVTKRLIEDHNGSIAINRNPDGGLTVRIMLPVSQHEHPPES